MSTPVPFAVSTNAPDPEYIRGISGTCATYWDLCSSSICLPDLSSDSRVPGIRCPAGRISPVKNGPRMLRAKSRSGKLRDPSSSRPAFWIRAAQEIVVRTAISCVLRGEKLSDLAGMEDGIFSIVG